jgi:hypothetical protein
LPRLTTSNSCMPSSDYAGVPDAASVPDLLLFLHERKPYIPAGRCQETSGLPHPQHQRCEPHLLLFFQAAGGKALTSDLTAELNSIIARLSGWQSRPAGRGVPGARMPGRVISDRTCPGAEAVVRLGGRSPAVLSRSLSFQQPVRP